MSTMSISQPASNRNLLFEKISRELRGVKYLSNGGVLARCIFHDDHRPSLRVSPQGTAKELLTLLTDYVPERVQKSKVWPKLPRGLSGRLRRAATFLRQVGVNVEFYREAGSGSRRLILLSRIREQICVATLATVASDAETQAGSRFWVRRKMRRKRGVRRKPEP